jgi:carboxyl-terminal processing protease
MLKRVTLLLLLGASLAVGAVGIFVVGLYLGGHPSNLPNAIRERVLDDSQSQRFNAALDQVNATYYKDISKETLVDNAITGMVEDLKDPFSQYLTPKEYREFQKRQAQQFSGIGVAVGQDDKGLRILKIYSGSPAREAGLKIGDVITSADGKSLKGLKQDRAVALVKGPEGTTVKLGIDRKGDDPRGFKVTRRAITVPSVGSRLREYKGKTFQQIAVGGFSQDDVTEQVEREIRKGKKKGVDGIVLDLRGNPGGLVTEAQGVAGEFLQKNKLIVSTRGRAVRGQTLRAEGNPDAPKIPLVVLVDRGSASASEIVAGALQDHKRAKLVGSRTFGKGVFQQVIEMPDGGALDITAGQYFTPKGRNLGGAGTEKGAGLTPDVRVPGDPNTAKWREKALETALDTLAAESR